MISFYKQLFFTAKFFIAASLIVILFAVSFVVHWLFPIGQFLLIILSAVTISDVIVLTGNKRKLQVERIVPSIMSLGDENKIIIKIKNTTPYKIKIIIYDDLPFQLQKRDFKIESVLKKREEKFFEYYILPTTRGKYIFGNINIFVNSPIGFISQKQEFKGEVAVHVYPSIIQMKKYELKGHSLYMATGGIKKHRRLGHSYEFDQIKEYVIGEDSRSINWKASSRKGVLMVNQYQDERSQQVYSIIDKSRVMRMPFNNLTLLDYSINSALVISNTALQKHDKAGLITFSDKIGTIIPAEKSTQQLKKILEALYNEQEHFLDAEYELLYHLIRNVIKNRSLIFLYTNFESLQAFERVLPIFRKINNFHFLVVIFFDNEDVTMLSKNPVNKLYDIYVQTMAKKYLHDKGQIINELSNHGIHAIKSLPNELSINSINKYLELKSRGMI
jgi:uncharacterized protein (DUF58 family)